MSSPCKRIKLTPKKTIISPRTTQESKITSTPQRSSQEVASPNISSIASIKSRRNLSDVYEADENPPSTSRASNDGLDLRSPAPSSAVVDIESEADYDAYFNNLGKIKYVGTIWKSYKPINENTLYAQVLEDPFNAHGNVTELFLFYNRNPKAAVISLIKFCVDVCGFQNFNVVQHYKFQENSAKELISLLESDEIIDQHENLKSTGRYLLMEPRIQLAKTLKMGIYNFVQKLISIGHERGLLYDEFLSKNLFTFVKCMSFSNLRSVRHTGVIFGVKIMTALVKTYNNILNDSRYLADLDDSDILDNSTTVRLREQKLAFDNLLEYFYFIFIKNCRLQDNKLLLMRVECIRELQIWIRYFPRMFVSELQAVNYLLKLIIDASKEVRYAALEACEHIFEIQHIMDFMKPYKQELTEAIGKRFYDVDYKVAIKAIDIFVNIFRLDESLITAHRFKLLTTLIFDKYFPIGEAACRFLASYLQASGDDSEAILVNLVKLSSLPGNFRKQLLVEGCLYIIPEIHNWKLYTKMMLEKELEHDVLEALAELFAEAVHQSLKGKSTKMREASRTVLSIDRSEHMKIAKLLPTLNELLREYSDYPKILVEILKIFPLLSNNILNDNFCKDYMDLCEIAGVLFNHHNDETLLNQLGEILNHLCTVPDFSERAKRFAKNLSAKFAKELVDFLSQPNDKDCNVTLKVALLYSQFNLNERFSWDNLFVNWGEVNEATTANLLLCCKWYLIWSLRNLTDTTQTRQPRDLSNLFVSLLRTCNEFISTCFNMLQNLKGQALHYKVYESLCDFYFTYSKDLTAPIKFNKQFEKLKLEIDDKQLQDLLIYFVDKYVISNEEMSLDDRRENVVKYFDLVHNNVLPIEALANIFKYYHCYNSEYGPIIESSLTSMADSDDENTILLMVVYTLTNVYEQILSKFNSIDMRTDEAKNLKLLVKQFLAFKYFRTPKKQLRTLVYFSINYSFKDDSKYAFLYFITYFVDLIVDKASRKEMFDYFKQKLPENAAKNDAVLYFSNHLKGTGSIPLKRGQAKKTTPNLTVPNENKEVAKKKKRPVKKQTTKKDKENVNKKEAKNTKATKVIPSASVFNNTSTKASENKKRSLINTETEISEDDLTIHDDSDSDDIEESMTGLRI